MPVPRALPTDEVAEHVQSYAHAARRAVDAGFDGVELHGANGYLISQFLSSNANQRGDCYGGSIANRIRFAVEAAAATVETVGAARTGILLSPGGGVWDAIEDDAAELNTALLTELARLDLACVHLEATTDEDTLLQLRNAWPGTLIINPTMPGGAKQTGKSEADHWLGLGADLIAFGRAFLANPDLAERLRAGLPVAPADENTFYQRAVPQSVVDQRAASDAVHRQAEERPHTGCMWTFRQHREVP